MHSEGLDFSGIPERWAAMQQARDTGHSIATAKHAYLHDPIAGAIIMVFTPVYDLKLPISTVEQRRIALKGFVFATFVVEEVVERIMGLTFKNLFDLEIYDEVVGRQSILYDGDKEPHVLVGIEAYFAGMPVWTIRSRSLARPTLSWHGARMPNCIDRAILK
jgi:hypothetical protein